MRCKSAWIIASVIVSAASISANGSVIAAYNFGPNSTSFTYAATTLAANVTASGLNSVVGTNTTLAPDDGLGGNWYSNNGGGGNYLTVSTTGSTTDNGFWIATI